MIHTAIDRADVPDSASYVHKCEHGYVYALTHAERRACAMTSLPTI